jgi:hypothetical protein
LTCTFPQRAISYSKECSTTQHNTTQHSTAQHKQTTPRFLKDNRQSSDGELRIRLRLLFSFFSRFLLALPLLRTSVTQLRSSNMATPGVPGRLKTPSDMKPQIWGSKEERKVMELLSAQIEAENRGETDELNMGQTWSLLSTKLQEHGYSRTPKALQRRFGPQVKLDQPWKRKSGLGNKSISPDLDDIPNYSMPSKNGGTVRTEENDSRSYAGGESAQANTTDSSDTIIVEAPSATNTFPAQAMKAGPGQVRGM